MLLLPLRSRKRRGRRAGVFIFSMLTVVIAGFAVVSWLQFVTHGQRAAAHDRARLQAFYAAEAGLEEVINYFNRPQDYEGADPAPYTEGMAASPFPDAYEGAPDYYNLFEPYILSVMRDASGQPVLDEEGDVNVTRSTYMRDLSDGYSTKIPTCRLQVSDRLIFRDANGHERARVTDLILVNPNEIPAGEAQPAQDDYVFAKVISRAETPEGVSVTVEAMMSENPLYRITSPAAIISEATTLFSGNFNVHWGEVWARGDIPLPSNWNSSGASHIPTQTEDPWVYLRTSGILRDHTGLLHADGRQGSGFSANALLPGDPNYYVPYLESVLPTGTGGNGNGKGGGPFADYENLLQHDQNLEFPQYSYEELKKHFISFGLPYYYTDANGNIYGVERDERDPHYGEVVSKTFDEWFDIDPSDPSYWDPTQVFVFIDSVPVNDEGQVDSSTNGAVIDATYYPRNPEAGGLMATIPQAGGGVHSRGIMFCANAIDFSGQGRPPRASQIIGPDEEPYILSPYDEEGNQFAPPSNTTISHNGMIYCWGDIEITGNRTYYGSLYSKTGFTGSGRPEVWYNEKLKDGLWLENVQSRVVRMAWNIRINDLPQVN